jgi:hypothetical protein
LAQRQFQPHVKHEECRVTDGDFKLKLQCAEFAGEHANRMRRTQVPDYVYRATRRLVITAHFANGTHRTVRPPASAENGQLLPFAHATKPPFERLVHSETCRMPCGSISAKAAAGATIRQRRLSSCIADVGPATRSNAVLLPTDSKRPEADDRLTPKRSVATDIEDL